MDATDRIDRKRLEKYHGGELAIALMVYASTMAGVVQADNEVGWRRWLATLLNAFIESAEKARAFAKERYGGIDVCSGRARKGKDPAR
jgi:hypothetical protein